MEEAEIPLETRLGTGLYDCGDPFPPTHPSTDKNQDEQSTNERNEIHIGICNMLNDTSSHDTTTDDEKPGSNDAPPCTNSQENMYKNNFTRLTRMARNYNSRATFNTACFNF
eukprot:9239779-Heterocapsa_arctica.AAC.1